MTVLPQVAIVGRTNVGKSTLFNRLSVDVKSITLDEHGVTRDFLSDTVCWLDRCFTLVDTGGISLRKTDDALLKQVRQQAINFLEQSDLVLFVVDPTVGILPEDQEISKLMHRLGKKVILVLNKTDAKGAQEHLYDFVRLGHAATVAVSAQHGTGIGDLLELIVADLPQKGQRKEVEPQARVVILGKPNVGKSSLMNVLTKQERAIVADFPGTTREALKETISFYKQDIQLTDTAGIRRKRSVKEPLEEMMVKSSFRAMKDADIVLLVIDASQAMISDQELKLAFYAFEQGKALILVYNKDDITDEETQERLDYNLEEYEFFFKKLSSITISCKTGKNVGKVLPLIQKVWERYSQRFSDEEITLFFKEALMKKQLFHNKQLLRLYSAKQVKTAPITLVLKVNMPEWFGPSQLGFFDNLLRRKYDLQSVPVMFLPRK